MFLISAFFCLEHELDELELLFTSSLQKKVDELWLQWEKSAAQIGKGVQEKSPVF